MKRATRQRAEIAEILNRSNNFLTAQELHDELRRTGSTVGLTTVYRNLQWLVDTDSVDVIVGDGGEALYRKCGSAEHHHHLVCTGCRRSVEVQAEAVERWADSTARDHGFAAVTHVAELFGLCSRCSSG